MKNRPIFSSHLASILTLIGVAIGLGNVWRFPYMMGKYGGSAFLFVYLIFTLLFALPALIAEIGLGRISRKGIQGAFTQALGETSGKIIGGLLLFTILIASCYYTVVIGNVFFSAGYSAIEGFHTTNFEQYSSLLNNGWLQYGISILVSGSSLFVLHKGLKRGIESLSKIVVPFFLIVIIYLIFTAFSLDGAKAHFLNFLQPDFGALKAEHIFAALGQSFYSLSLGGTFMIIYGGYLKSEERLPKLAVFTAIGDVGAALLAALFIVPTILVFNLDMTSGPQLIFNTLPNLFKEMVGGQFLGTLFLFALALVALLSLIAALEVIVRSCEDFQNKKWSRTKIIIGLGLLEFLIILPIALKPSLIGTLDLIFGSGMQVLGSGLAVVALAWGIKKANTVEHLFGKENAGKFQFFHFWIKWVIPVVLLSVLIGYLYNELF